MRERERKNMRGASNTRRTKKEEPSVRSAWLIALWETNEPAKRRGKEEWRGGRNHLPCSPMKIASSCAAYYLLTVITITPGTQVDSLLIASKKAKPTTQNHVLHVLQAFFLSIRTSSDCTCINFSLSLSLSLLYSRHRSLIVLL